MLRPRPQRGRGPGLWGRLDPSDRRSTPVTMQPLYQVTASVPSSTVSHRTHLRVSAHHQGVLCVTYNVFVTYNRVTGANKEPPGRGAALVAATPLCIPEGRVRARGPCLGFTLKDWTKVHSRMRMV